MKFSKQPNGNWCGCSTISDSFYESNMTEQMLLREIIADAALNIAMRYFELTQNNGGYCFDDIIDEFKSEADNIKASQVNIGVNQWTFSIPDFSHRR